jgi:hypothetical protein
MDNKDIISSNEVIDTSANNEQAELFEQAIENLEPEDLVAINEYLNAGVPNESHWRDYWDAFAKFEWKDFSNAYAEVMGRPFSLE